MKAKVYTVLLVLVFTLLFSSSTLFLKDCYTESNDEQPNYSPASISSLSPLPDNGAYYIRNAYTGKYLSTFAGIIIQATDFTGSNDQKWNIRLFNEGYVITSFTNITPSSGNNTICLFNSNSYTVSLQTGGDPGNNIGRCWNISIVGNNAYISCKRNTSYFLSSTPNNGVVATTALSSYSGWELVSCSDPYVLPGVTGGDFSTNKYNTTGFEGLKNRMNCYSYSVGFYGDYAVNQFDQNYESVQPGYASNQSFNLLQIMTISESESESELTTDGINQWASWLEDALKDDLAVFYGESYSNRVYKSSQSEVMVGPWKKIALVINPKYYYPDPYHITFPDYHWLLETEDGYWTHKMGLLDALTVDFSNQLISDPQNCNLGNYYVFVDYYKIKMDVIPEYVDSIYQTAKDSSGDIETLAQNLGLISIEPLSSPIVYSTLIDYCAPYYSDPNERNYAYHNSTVNTFMWSGDVDWFEFMVSETGTYDIYSGGAGAGDLYGAIYANGILISSDDDSGASGQFLMSITLNPGVLYKLRVSGFSDDEEVSYYTLNFYRED